MKLLGMEPKSLIKGRPFFDDLRTALKTYRAATDMSQDDVARMVGVSRAQISNFENGKSLPREDALEKILETVRSPFTLMANETRELSEMLLSRDISDDVKISRFLKRLDELKVVFDGLRGQLKK